MSLITHIREAFNNLVKSKLRSMLAILGVLVGTGSVVALISSSQLATAHALAQFKTLGTNLLSMSVMNKPGEKQSSEQKKLVLADMPKVISASSEIRMAAPFINLYQSIYFHGKTFNGQVMGATQNIGIIAKMKVARGRFVTEADNESFFCVIGTNIAKAIRKTGIDPLGKTIKVGNRIFTIIGVAKPWQPNLFLFADINDGVIIPLKTSYLLSKNAQINDVLFRLIKKPHLKKVQSQLTDYMSQLLPHMRVQFRNPEQIIQIVDKQRKTFTWLLAAIGGISLIVGGIGVMNIMLVSVIERKREIGIRMALGAKSSDIMRMFLIESVVLTLFGGLLGVICGVSTAAILAGLTAWVFHFYWMPPILGFVVSALVGVLSGFYPSYRASKLDPIQCLRGS